MGVPLGSLGVWNKTQSVGKMKMCPTPRVPRSMADHRSEKAKSAFGDAKKGPIISAAAKEKAGFRNRASVAGKLYGCSDRVTPILDILDMNGLLVPTYACFGTGCSNPSAHAASKTSVASRKRTWTNSRSATCHNCGSGIEASIELYADGQESCKCGAVVAMSAAYSMSHEKQMSFRDDKTTRGESVCYREDTSAKRSATMKVVPGVKAGLAVHRAQSLVDRIAIAEGHSEGQGDGMCAKELARQRRIFVRLEEIFDELRPVAENVKAYVRREVGEIWKVAVKHSRACPDKNSCGLRVVDRSAMAIARSAVKWIAGSSKSSSAPRQFEDQESQHVLAALRQKMKGCGALVLGTSSSHLATSCAMFEVMRETGYDPTIPCTRRPDTPPQSMSHDDDRWWTGLFMDLERICFYHDRQIPRLAEASARRLLHSRPVPLMTDRSYENSQPSVHIAYFLVHLLVCDNSVRSNSEFVQKKNSVAQLINIHPKQIDAPPNFVRQVVHEFLTAGSLDEFDDPFA